MKICLINNLYYPFNRGGAEQVVFNIAQGLKEDQQDVFVISSKPFLTQMENKVNGIKVIRFFPWNIFWIGNISQHKIIIRLFWHFFDVINFFSFFQIRTILKKEKPDVVITHNLKGIGYLIPLAIKRLGIKHFHTVHDIQLINPSGLIIFGQENNWLNKCFLVKIYQNINKILFSFPPVVISPSKWLMNFYYQRGFFQKQKRIILPNPIFLKQADEKNNFLQKNKFIYVGQLEKTKGILFLIKILKKLKEDYELLIVGSGSQEEKIKKIIRENKKIKFLGQQENKKVKKLYQEASLTIVPSLCYENSPTVIYESLSAGTPVLASQIGGVSELIVAGENGYTFCPGDSDDFLEKIKLFLRKKDDLFLMRKKSIASVRQYTIQNYLETIKKLFY